jgi:hypothetical protein
MPKQKDTLTMLENGIHIHHDTPTNFIWISSRETLFTKGEHVTDLPCADLGAIELPPSAVRLPSANRIIQTQPIEESIQSIACNGDAEFMS